MPTACGVVVGAGRGISRAAAIRAMEIEKRKIDDRPASLSKWAKWQGGDATETQSDATERLMRGTVANSHRQVYKGLFNKWVGHRSVL